MPVNAALGHLSNAFMIAALVIYSFSVFAFAGDFAFGRPRRAAEARGQQETRDRAAALATVGVAPVTSGAAASETTISQAPEPPEDRDVPAAPGARGPAAPGAGGPAAGRPAAGRPAAGGTSAGAMPELAVPAFRAIREAGRLVVAAVLLSSLGVAAHTTAVITRGLAVHRAPWGNMYEFLTALTCIAALFFLVLLIRYQAWTLGVFVMGAVVVTLGLAETLVYTAPGDLVPALQSYWLDIHVTAMTLATGIFFVAAVLGLVYLWIDRYTRRVAVGRAAPGHGIIRRLPGIEQIDRLTYRTVVFGFPVWTFGVIAGAIWADQAWGRYWGWDPVETWAFITWVLYAAFLHARATAGWRGRRAHYVQLLGFAALIFNILVVQVFIAGLHSYSGVG
ncbi:MAG TPA: c-type cytochrome biogenesis protein CcsB [Streptosporangiaceae bacterium]|nr:c-type cytochrome biogenesis protein CcsB [Streptosporangiaceae bacterium]